MTERSLGGDSHQRLMAGKTQRFTSNRFERAPRLERLTEQHWDVHLGQTLCDVNRLSHSCQRKFNEFFSFSICLFVYRVVPIEGFGRGNASAIVLHPWRLATHPHYPPYSRLCPHLPSTCIDLCAIKQCDSCQFFYFMQTKDKNRITNCYFSSSPLVQLSQAQVSVGTMENWFNLRKKIKQVEADTSDMEPHWTLGEP